MHHPIFSRILAALMLASGLGLSTAAAAEYASPNKLITLDRTAGGFSIAYSGRQVIEIPSVGITTTGHGQDLTFRQVEGPRRIKADYRMLAGKRLHCTNRANEYAFVYADAKGQAVRLVFRLYDDGAAFRYELSGLADERLTAEHTTYRIPEGTRRWMMPWTDGYEGFYTLATTGRNRNHRWAFPALIETSAVPGAPMGQGSVFALLTEANIERRQSAASMWNDRANTEFNVRPDQNELALSGAWHTPWRVLIIGSLATVVESTLVTDLSEPCQIGNPSWVEPGVVSWVYWAHNHGSNDLNIIRQYVDMAVSLHLPYVLIDAEWDGMKDGKSVEDAVAYAREQGIKPMIWYNSSVGWVNGAPSPKYRLNKPEDREKEFAWCERIGVAGVKIDFFSGDNQMNMDYCIDLLEATARHHLLCNFHGAPIPRGWQRTYPNLLSTEGVYGAEWYNNVPTFTDRAAAHNATLPFTRNVIGPMDYTPCAFSDSQHPHITTHAHELALTVLYESGLQHLADRPESFLAQPPMVQDFLGKLPAVWDDTRLIGGYPADHVVIARRSGKTWYVAGINGRESHRTFNLAGLVPVVGKVRHVSCFLDADEDRAWQLAEQTTLPATVRVRPRGGFVLVVNGK